MTKSTRASVVCRNAQRKTHYEENGTNKNKHENNITVYYLTIRSSKKGIKLPQSIQSKFSAMGMETKLEVNNSDVILIFLF